MSSVAASGTFVPPLGPCTISDASPAVIGFAGHGLTAGDAVVFSVSSGGSLPTGLVAGTTYYVIASGLTATAFEVSATPGGAAVNTSTAGSGTFSLVSEHILFVSSATSSHFYFVSMRNQDAGDQSVLRVYRKVLSTGPFDVLYESQFSNQQLPQVYSPLGQVSGAGMAAIPVEAAIAGGLQFALSQIAATPPVSGITVTIATPAVFTLANHGLNAGEAVSFTTTGALPTGLTAGTTYYASAASLTANTFEVSDTPAHALAGTNMIATTGAQSGTHSAVYGGGAYDYSIETIP